MSESNDCGENSEDVQNETKTFLFGVVQVASSVMCLCLYFITREAYLEISSRPRLHVNN